MARHLKDLLIPYQKRQTISGKLLHVLDSFLESYEEVALSNGKNIDELIESMTRILSAIEKQILSPYVFPPYHQMIRHPIDYYQLGIDFISPLIKLSESTLTGSASIRAIDQAIKHKENAILFANHQIEADPQVISIMLEENFPALAEKMIFVAGERVLVDPLAAPFSIGRNLLCIYSKKYIDTPPEHRDKKQLHNKKTMQLMSELLTEGGKCIYVAPSGGRDRPNAQGIVELAPFDPQSIEMFYLMAKRSKTKTHFFPLSLATYSVLPPPETTQIELGEKRVTRGGATHIHFGTAIDMEHIPGLDHLDKHSQRKVKTDYIFNLVKTAYDNFNVNY
ncbi:MAG: 1-acyl-sn-glycerol-3-phosphate acyltransferase [Simkaniaceae bacterium]|nr:1-acyl-sn-glycerol-3-phosphate acyltransferase [Simkaniaceae bacterium]